MGATSYKELVVWQISMKLAEDVYRASAKFPNDEKFGLTSQVRRSCVSVAANIAEGFGRDSPKSFAQFLRVSQGSLKETETHLILAGRLEFGDRQQLIVCLKKCDEIGKMLRSLISKVGKHGPRTKN